MSRSSSLTPAGTGKIAYASAGAGSTTHVARRSSNGWRVQDVPCPLPGGAPAVLDTVAGQTQLFFTAVTQTIEHVRAGKLTLLAVTESKRAALLPDVPTVAETIPGYEMAVWYGAFGPAVGCHNRSPTGSTGDRSRSCSSCQRSRGRWPTSGWRVSTPPRMSSIGPCRADIEKWGRLIKDLGIGASDGRQALHALPGASGRTG